MKRRNFANSTHATTSSERWIYGVHAVGGWVRIRPAHLHAVHYDPQAGPRIAELVRRAAAAGVTVQPDSAPVLLRLAGTTRHQGILARSQPFPYAELTNVSSARPRLLVVADQLQDPHNLGALMRTAEAVGAGAVILPKDGSVAVSATVEAAAAGAAALLPVCRVTNVARSLGLLKDAGYWIVALAAHGGHALFQCEIPEPVVLVLGGESGIRPLVTRQCDLHISIPMFGKGESLNASVAVAVVLYELRRRWEVAVGR